MVRVIGITGGIGAGKSKVMEYLASFPKVMVIYADEVAKELMKPGGEGHYQLVRLFGPSIMRPDGILYKEKLMKIFEDEDMRQQVNKIIHPLVLGTCQQKIVKGRHYTLAFIESAILYEANGDSICDEVWYIDADEDIRRRRLMLYRGYSYKEAMDRIQSQKEIDKVKEKVDYILENHSMDFSPLKEIIRKKLQEYAVK